MSDVKLVPMTDRHLASMMAIERAVFETPWTAEMFRQELRGVFGSYAMVAVLDDCVVGYQIAWFIEDEAHLVNIAVDTPHQGKGIGARMLRRLIEEALGRRCTIITLEVRASNEAAQGFYRRFFFKTVGVRKGYYSDNREDALLMALDLKALPGAGANR